MAAKALHGMADHSELQHHTFFCQSFGLSLACDVRQFTIILVLKDFFIVFVILFRKTIQRIF